MKFQPDPFVNIAHQSLKDSNLLNSLLCAREISVSFDIKPENGSFTSYNIVNIGEINSSEIHQEDTPLGYEDDDFADTNQVRYFEKQVVIQAFPTPNIQHGDMVTLVQSNIIPSNSKHRPELLFHHEDSDSTGNLSLSVGASIRFALRFDVPPGFTGSLNRLVVLEFSVMKVQGLYATKTNFLVGFLVLGKVIDLAVPADSSNKRELSLEAKPFNSTYNIFFFDTEVIFYKHHYRFISLSLTECVCFVSGDWLFAH